MITFVGSTFSFDRELWLGGFSNVGYFDIKEERKGKVVGSVLVCSTDIVFETGWSGCRRVHAASVGKDVK